MLQLQIFLLTNHTHFSGHNDLGNDASAEGELTLVVL